MAELLGYYTDTGESDFKTANEKRERIRTESAHFEEVAKVNREKKVEADRKLAELHFEASARETFFKANPSADEVDFRRCYSELKDEFFLNNFRRERSGETPGWQSDLN